MKIIAVAALLVSAFFVSSPAQASASPVRICHFYQPAPGSIWIGGYEARQFGCIVPIRH